jgi:hypothetical protein
MVDTLKILEHGTIEMEGLVSWGSNYTFLVTVCLEDNPIQGIYKPRQGERPLWDFATGTLCLRERAAYLVSEALGWEIIPVTLLRDGPRGWGSVQLFIEHDPEETYFNFQGLYDEQLQRIALFDILTNNADRKGGHVVRDENDHLWGIDHGICFHEEYKLRTVIWDYAGQPIPAAELNDLQQMLNMLEDPRTQLRVELQQLLSGREIKALQGRVSDLLKQKRFLVPGPGRHYPWPLV